MRTKANIKGHAIHQMLIPFPIGFLVGSFIADAGGLLFYPNLVNTGYYLALAGIIAAFIAATFGFIDFFYSIPPGSSGQKRGIKHLRAMLLAVLVFLIALLFKKEPGYVSPAIVLMEFAGVVLLTIGGWHGGTLVTRNFIGPDHRYANAGKWKEKTFSVEQKEYEAADKDELKVNQMKLIRIRDKRIVLARTEDGYVSFSDSCTHRGGSLAGGVMICGIVQCLWHGSQFNTKTGTVVAGPAQKNIETYSTVEKNGKVFISAHSPNATIM